MVSRRSISIAVAQELLAGQDAHQVLQRLAAYLVAHKRVTQADYIIGDIEDYLAEHGMVVADIITARGLSEDLRSTIETYVSQQTAAKSVALREHIDPTILGGIIVKTPDSVLDASVRTKLKRLA